MSELTQCNYCSLREIKRSAKRRGWNYSKRNAAWGMGGINIYVHPVEIKIPKDNVQDSEFHKKYFRSWFMEIGENCSC